VRFYTVRVFEIIVYIISRYFSIYAGNNIRIRFTRLEYIYLFHDNNVSPSDGKSLTNILLSVFSLIRKKNYLHATTMWTCLIAKSPKTVVLRDQTVHPVSGSCQQITVKKNNWRTEPYLNYKMEYPMSGRNCFIIRKDLRRLRWCR